MKKHSTTLLCAFICALLFNGCSDDEGISTKSQVNAPTYAYAISMGDSLRYISEEEYNQRISVLTQSKDSSSTPSEAKKFIPLPSEENWSEDVDATIVVAQAAQASKQKMVAYGYQNKECIQKGGKVGMSSALKQELGLQSLFGGIIIYDMYKVTQQLSCIPNYEIAVAPYTIKIMGKAYGTVFNPAEKYTFTFTVNKVPPAGVTSFIGTTYLAFIRSDLGGTVINKWYPCSPEQLIWGYTLDSEVSDWDGF